MILSNVYNVCEDQELPMLQLSNTCIQESNIGKVKVDYS